MCSNVCKWHIQSAYINFKAKILLNLPLYVLKNLRKYVSAIYQQNYNFHFQPSIGGLIVLMYTLPYQKRQKLANLSRMDQKYSIHGLISLIPACPMIKG